jgi:hypothetical protein
MCHFNSVHYVNFEEIWSDLKFGNSEKGKPSENRAEFGKILPDFQIEIPKSLCIFGVFHRTRSAQVHTGKIGKSV